MTHHRRRNNGIDPSKINETVELSPAQRYAAFKQTQAKQRTVAAEFARSMPFELDEFQMQANDALEAGDNVLVAAPTGAGKTVAADFAIYLAQTRNVKAFYTTPIKALSNQKYHDLVDQYGMDKVGLLTGDTSINSEADIVVMTTEVLRNMLYEHSVTLEALRYVILDEVHYLADRFRGPVWEEVIIHLPKKREHHRSFRDGFQCRGFFRMDRICSWQNHVGHVGTASGTVGAACARTDR